jgi:hypothetical protein
VECFEHNGLAKRSLAHWIRLSGASV